MIHVLTAALILIAPAAHALQCGEPLRVAAAMRENGWQTVFWGDTPDSETITIWISPKDGWAAIVLTESGQACFVAVGDDWGVQKPGVEG